MNEQAELRRLGETVRRMREQQRLTVAELATTTGIAAQSITDLEAGRLDPTYEGLIALARGLDVRMSALLTP